MPEVCSLSGAKSDQLWEKRTGKGLGWHPGDHKGTRPCAGFCGASTWSPSKQTHLGVFLTKHLLSILFNNCFNTKMH